MAMHDWNGNGNRNDRADHYIEYQVYKDSADRTGKNSDSGRGFLIACIIAGVASLFFPGLGVLILLGYGLLKFLGM